MTITMVSNGRCSIRSNMQIWKEGVYGAMEIISEYFRVMTTNDSSYSRPCIFIGPFNDWYLLWYDIFQIDKSIFLGTIINIDIRIIRFRYSPPVLTLQYLRFSHWDIDYSYLWRLAFEIYSLPNIITSDLLIYSVSPRRSSIYFEDTIALLS